MEISLDATRHFLCSSIKTNSSLLKNTISNPTQLRWKHFIKHRCHRRTHFSQSIEKFVYVNSFRVQFSEAHLKTRTIFGFSQCCLLFRKSWFIFAQIPIYDQTEKGLINGRLCKTYYGYKILGWWGWKDFWVNEFRRRAFECGETRNGHDRRRSYQLTYLTIHTLTYLDMLNRCFMSENWWRNIWKFFEKIFLSRLWWWNIK